MISIIHESHLLLSDILVILPETLKYRRMDKNNCARAEIKFKQVLVELLSKGRLWVCWSARRSLCAAAAGGASQEMQRLAGSWFQSNSSTVLQMQCRAAAGSSQIFRWRPCCRVDGGHARCRGYTGMDEVTHVTHADLLNSLMLIVLDDSLFRCSCQFVARTSSISQRCAGVYPVRVRKRIQAS